MNWFLAIDTQPKFRVTWRSQLLSARRQLRNGLTVLALLFFVFPDLARAQQPLKTEALEGQLVCSFCWFEHDRKKTAYGSDEDLKCAIECAEKGIPPALAVKSGGDYKLFTIEKGTVKKTPADWLELISKQVRIIGQTRVEKGKLFLSPHEVLVIGTAEASQSQISLIGTEAELALQDLYGIEQKLSSYRGRIVILNFWSTWCVPCRTEMPDLAAMQNEYAAFGVQVVGAAADTLSDRDKVLKFVKEAKINFPIWLGMTTDDMKRFGVGPALPATLVINREGKIDSVYPGVIRKADLQRRIDEMLKSDEAMAKRSSTSPPDRQDVSLVPS